jgi:hypothetical protein
MNNFINIRNVLEGCLLGDGFLELQKHSKNASLKYGSSSKQHAEYIHNFFSIYCNENNQKITRREVFDKRTEKTYINYSFSTKALPIFTEQHNRFYVNKIKIVPLDLEINNILLLMWYIGDGELDKKNGYIKLHTNAFTFQEVNFLCNKLSNFEAKPQRKTKSQYLVTIPRKCAKSFLKYIGDCPINDYNHKWSEVEYKNKNIEANGFNFYKDVYPLIEEDFIKKNHTIYELHKKYNVPIKAIKNYFNQNKIEWNPIDTKKKIIQYDFNGKIIFKWNSGQEIKRELSYNASAISECCRGIRRQYKNYIWKFDNSL